MIGTKRHAEEEARNEDACLLILDDALTALARIDPGKRAIVEMRFFLGLSVEETAETLAIPAETAARELRLAQAWLRREVQRRRLPAAR
jgi:RNA polymerase sigma factor (sigma-70 family)